MGVLVRASSQSESLYLNSMFLKLSGKPCLPFTRRFNSISNSCSSRCKRAGSVEVVATICPGHVHTALNLQVPLRLPIPQIQTNPESKLKIEGRSYSTEKGYSFGAQKFHRQQVIVRACSTDTTTAIELLDMEYEEYDPLVYHKPLMIVRTN